MTRTVEPAEAVIEALAVIDEGLLSVVKRELVSANEVADLLLDVRSILTTVEADV
ncbi:MAG: hypothetical protein OEY23_00820 [Acidimicrobiia bacterium]|nr:hypothetical protein [Acidimicrobiia bacterium]